MADLGDFPAFLLGEPAGDFLARPGEPFRPGEAFLRGEPFPPGEAFLRGDFRPGDFFALLLVWRGSGDGGGMDRGGQKEVERARERRKRGVGR